MYIFTLIFSKEPQKQCKDVERFIYKILWKSLKCPPPPLECSSCMCCKLIAKQFIYIEVLRDARRRGLCETGQSERALEDASASSRLPRVEWLLENMNIFMSKKEKCWTTISNVFFFPPSSVWRERPSKQLLPSFYFSHIIFFFLQITNTQTFDIF